LLYAVSVAHRCSETGRAAYSDMRIIGSSNYANIRKLALKLGRKEPRVAGKLMQAVKSGYTAVLTPNGFLNTEIFESLLNMDAEICIHLSIATSFLEAQPISLKKELAVLEDLANERNVLTQS
jgi:hypothetical protein